MGAEQFDQCIKESLDQPKKFIEETFQRLEIKAKKLKISDAATDNELRAFEKKLSKINKD